MIRIESDKQNYSILLPTSIDEITKEVLDNMLAGIKVSKYHCIVALIYEEKLFSLVSAITKGSGASKVVPIVAKMGENAESDIIKPMDRIIIDKASLERGVHVRVSNNYLDPNIVGNYIMEDSELVKDIQTGRYFNDGETSDHVAKMKSPSCYFVEFKVIPLSDICGGIDTKEVSTINHFKVINSELN